MTKRPKTGYQIAREMKTAELRVDMEAQRGYMPLPAVWRHPPPEPTATDGIVATVLLACLNAIRPKAKRRAV